MFEVAERDCNQGQGAATSTGIDLEHTWDQALTGLQPNRDIGVRRVGDLRPYNLLGVTDSPTAPAEPADADAPRHRYTAELAGRIERDWQDSWTRSGTFNVPNPVGSLAPTDGSPIPDDKMFVQDMFPYPSGEGLHVGHPLGYIATDVYARYFRMVGRNVLHALGFDAFGLPAEQYAVQTGTHPRTRTEANIVNFRRQLGRLGFGHDSRRSFSTTDVEFYKWTQWIFLQIYNAWFDTTADKARSIADLVAEFDSGAGNWATAGIGRRCRQGSAPTWSTATAWYTGPIRWSTGVRAWAPCWPTKRSPLTAAASGGIFRCSGSGCGSG